MTGKQDLIAQVKDAVWEEVLQVWGISGQETEQLRELGLHSGLADTDPILFRALVAERRREQETLNLIASENHVTMNVLLAQGSILTNKYAEGYPGSKYYGGCDFANVAERLAVERACHLFDADHANVQPHSGSQANAAAYLVLLKPGDKVLAMRLDHGGHLTHGVHLNFSGQYYNFVHYGVTPDTERIDYGEVARLAREHRPRLIVAGASAYPRFIEFRTLREIADEVGSYLVVDIAHVAGLIAAKVHPSPIPYCEVVTGTTHKTLRGPRGGLILCKKQFAQAVDRAVFPGLQGGPLMHIVAAKAVALREAMAPEFTRYGQKIVENAKVLAETMQEEGFRLVSGGTDNHLMLVDLRPLGLTGDVAEKALDAIGISVNKNLIPYDPNPPRVTSGIRLGTPALTTRRIGAGEVRQIGRIISRLLHQLGDEKLKEALRREVQELCYRFPIPIVGKRV